jgi:hypothetical protein
MFRICIQWLSVISVMNKNHLNQIHTESCVIRQTQGQIIAGGESTTILGIN